MWYACIVKFYSRGFWCCWTIKSHAIVDYDIKMYQSSNWINSVKSWLCHLTACYERVATLAVSVRTPGILYVYSSLSLVPCLSWWQGGYSEVVKRCKSPPVLYDTYLHLHLYLIYARTSTSSLRFFPTDAGKNSQYCCRIWGLYFEIGGYKPNWTYQDLFSPPPHHSFFGYKLQWIQLQIH